MQLPQIDVVHAQSPQGSVEAVEQVGAGGVEPALAVGSRHTLGREHDGVPAPGVHQQSAEDLLGLAVGIDIGGVHEGATFAEEEVEQLRGLMLVGVPAPGHRSQRDSTHPQTAAPDRSDLHATNRSRAAPVQGGDRTALGCGSCDWE